MSGTRAGGIAAAAKIKAERGADFYANIGRIGGQKGHTGGFYANRELARAAGAKGGSISRRTKKVATSSSKPVQRATTRPTKRIDRVTRPTTR